MNSSVKKISENILKLGIVVSIFILVVETIPELASFKNIFYWVEKFLLALYLVEYVCRQFINKDINEKPIPIIDFLSIISLLASVIPFMPASFQILRWIGVLKLTRYTKVDDHLVKAFALVKKELIAFTLFIVLIMMICSTMMFYAEAAAQPDKFISIPHCFWWAITTLTTVGYGDLYPITAVGKVVAGFTMLAGVFFIAIPVAFWTMAINKIYEEEKNALNEKIKNDNLASKPNFTISRKKAMSRKKR